LVNRLRTEVLRSWEGAANLRTEWNQLQEASGCEHPFTTYEWFDCWYSAYCKPEDVAIVLVKEGDTLRAILPGMLIYQIIKGIPFNVFSYAGNGHSPRCGIISKKEDTEANKASLVAIWDHLGVKINLVTLMSIDAGSPTQFILDNLELPHLFLHIEHSFESPAFDISRGWGNYLGSRSKKFRQRIRQGRNRAERLGRLTYNIIPNDSVSEQDIERLKIIDSKTWQHREGSGLFSTIENGKFYKELLKTFGKHGQMILCFLKIGDSDVAYEIATSFGSKAFFLKYGYDPEFNKCSPGLLIQSYLAEHFSSLGFHEVDLVGEMSEEKEHWPTHKREHKNYWIINKRSLRGRILSEEIRSYRLLKKLIRMIKPDKPKNKRIGFQALPETEEERD